MGYSDSINPDFNQLLLLLNFIKGIYASNSSTTVTHHENVRVMYTELCK